MKSVIGYTLVETRQLQRHNKITNTKKRKKINRPLLPHYAIYATFDRLCRKQPSMPLLTILAAKSLLPLKAHS
jgi:hypothetical protein